MGGVGRVIAGFTGTQDGMTEVQAKALFHELIHVLAGSFPAKYENNEFHTGDCTGADEEAFDLVQAYALARNILHPPDNPAKRAFCKDASVTLPEKPYMERNHDIVDASVILLAAPGGFQEQLRSGTWATIRYALKRGVPVTVIWPGGQITRNYKKA